LPERLIEDGVYPAPDWAATSGGCTGYRLLATGFRTLAHVFDRSLKPEA
jgi:hypothetical protein